MGNKTFWAILGVAILALVSVFLFTYDPPVREDIDVETVNLEVRPQDHVKGNPEAGAILVEYIDFQCPACASAAPLVEQIAEEYSDDLAVVYRYYLVTGGNAFPAARAAEAAAAQDSFFAMASILMARQAEWSGGANPIGTFRSYAEELELDIEQFESDYNAQATTDRINQDVLIANQVGATGTPTFFLNGRYIQTPGSYEAFSALVEEAIAEARQVENVES